MHYELQIDISRHERRQPGETGGALLRTEHIARGELEGPSQTVARYLRALADDIDPQPSPARASHPSCRCAGSLVRTRVRAEGDTEGEA